MERKKRNKTLATRPKEKKRRARKSVLEFCECGVSFPFPAMDVMLVWITSNQMRGLWPLS